MATNGIVNPFVTLVSSDGFEFHVRRSAVCISPTLRNMLDPQSRSLGLDHPHVRMLTCSPGNFAEAQTGICQLDTINGVVLEKVVEYFYYAERLRDSEGVPDMEIPSELCLELLMAADFLLT
jgi:elongin-C